MNLVFKIKTQIRRLINNVIDFNRPTSHPFITGDGFRALAQHYYDDISDMNPDTVEKNDIVYVRSDFLRSFFKYKHPHIKEKYILISNNDDANIDEGYLKFVDEKIIHWFAQNLLFTNERITPIPIGIQNFRYNHIGKLNYFGQKIIKKDDDKIIKYGFSLASSDERLFAEKLLGKSSLSQKIKVPNQDEYIEQVKRSYFLASPQGRGIDCHRTWEAIYLKTIPILINCPMTEYFKRIGMPIFLIDSWNEISGLTKEKLESIYNGIYNTDSFPQANMEYWEKEIMNKKI
jgi:hypothetical protein